MTDPPVHVVAAAITDPRGRILLARRTAGREHAGLWEFPGGKREPGESAEAALVRELEEELGITVEVGPALICVPHAYADKRLHLDVRHVTTWRGTPKGREGQALAWVAPDMLDRYAMPPADRPVVAALQQPDCYLVTPDLAPGGGDAAERGWLQALERALDAGIRRVQLRTPALDPVRRHALLAQAMPPCRAVGAEVLVNGDVELARMFGAGLHLRAAQLNECRMRPVPAGVPLSASCHTDDELRRAEALGCDFAVLGPLRATATHPGAEGIGWARFASLCEQVTLPIYAIGGLAPADIAQARQHGAQGIAAIRGLWPPPG
jgi:8-oxo-dGTP diphosphatase